MKKANKVDDLKPEYKRTELGKGIRGKYYESYQSSHNLVLLKPEVASAFPTEQAVNKALMSLITIAKTAKTLTKKSS